MKLQTITIERFKRLERVSFDLSAVNVLVGGNNSGKSTIIQAVHFAFTLFQSLSVSNKWPAKTKRSTSVSPTDLIYVPSDDPYTLGYGGRLLEDTDRAIVLTFIFDDGQELSVNVRKGRITNILVEPENVELARALSSLGTPYTVFSPGLAGVSRTENYVSDGVMLRALARGDANIVLRNILYRLKGKPEWAEFEADLSHLFPKTKIEVHFEPSIDQFIDVKISEEGRSVPLDLAGTGLLQAIQILTYIHLFAPQFIILDEPDSHLHPNNQRLLCSLLSSLAIERGVQVLITTHSRHVLDAMYSDAKLLWVQDGSVSAAGPEDQIDILLEIGALDIKEKVQSGKFKLIVLTEDRITTNLQILLDNSGLSGDGTAILPYNGVTTVNLLKPLVKQIKDISQATIVVHRDRDFLNETEVERWKIEIRALGAEPFITKFIDVEGYFCTDAYITHQTRTIGNFDLAAVKAEMEKDEIEDIIISYVNGRVDVERKQGTIGKLDYGKLSAAASTAVRKDPLSLMKGKQKIAKLRQVLQTMYGHRFEYDKSTKIPSDPDLAAIATKCLPKVEK